MLDAGGRGRGRGREGGGREGAQAGRGRGREAALPRKEGLTEECDQGADQRADLAGPVKAQGAGGLCETEEKGRGAGGGHAGRGRKDEGRRLAHAG